jgi:hypothetical protein
MPGIDRSLPLRARPVIESEAMPLRTRLAAAHGDADQAARLLDEAARRFYLDIERLLVADEPTENLPAAARRRLRFGFAAAPAPIG